jgi:hypothetical protein
MRRLVRFALALGLAGMSTAAAATMAFAAMGGPGS